MWQPLAHVISQQHFWISHLLVIFNDLKLYFFGKLFEHWQYLYLLVSRALIVDIDVSFKSALNKLKAFDNTINFKIFLLLQLLLFINKRRGLFLNGSNNREFKFKGHLLMKSFFTALDL